MLLMTTFHSTKSYFLILFCVQIIFTYSLCFFICFLVYKRVYMLINIVCYFVILKQNPAVTNWTIKKIIIRLPPPTCVYLQGPLRDTVGARFAHGERAGRLTARLRVQLLITWHVLSMSKVACARVRCTVIFRSF